MTEQANVIREVCRFYFSDSSFGPRTNPFDSLRCLLWKHHPIPDGLYTREDKNWLQNLEMDLANRISGITLDCELIAEIVKPCEVDVQEYINNNTELMIGAKESAIADIRAGSMVYLESENYISVCLLQILVEHLHVNMRAFLEVAQHYVELITRHIPDFHRLAKNKKWFLSELLERATGSTWYFQLLRDIRNSTHDHAPSIDFRLYSDDSVVCMAAYEKVMRQKGKGLGGGPLEVPVIDAITKRGPWVVEKLPDRITAECLKCCGVPGWEAYDDRCQQEPRTSNQPKPLM